MRDTLIMVLLGLAIYAVGLVAVWMTWDFLKEWRD